MQYKTLKEAAIAGDLDQTKAFLRKAYPAHQIVSTGTLLQFVVRHNHTDVAILLMNYGAKVNPQDKFGNTALHEAASNGNNILVEQLLKHGANPFVCNKDGHTAGELAKRNGYKYLAYRLHPTFLLSYPNLSFSHIAESKKSENQNELLALRKTNSFITNGKPLFFARVAQSEENRNKIDPRGVPLDEEVNNYVHKKSENQNEPLDLRKTDHFTNRGNTRKATFDEEVDNYSHKKFRWSLQPK